MRSPLVSIQKLNAASTPTAEIWQTAKLCLKLGRLNQSLAVAYNVAQKDTSSQQIYREHYIEAVKLGAEFAEEIGDYGKAAYYWEQLTQHQPKDAVAWYGLGIAKANLEDYRGAQKALNQSLQLEPGNVKARNYLREIQQLLKG